MIKKELLDCIKERDNYVITFHQNPDGDAIGSGLALHFALQKMGKSGKVLSPNSVGGYLHWLPSVETVHIFDEAQAEGVSILKNADLIFCLDYNDASRTGLMENPILEAAGKKILIDHHLQPKDFTDYVIHDTASPATAQLIFLLLQELKVEIDQDIATCLYTGLMTDTGSFRFPSTTGQTHQIVAELMKTGFRHETVHESIYDTFTDQKLLLFGHCLSKQRMVLPDFQTSIMWVTQEDHKTFGIEKGDTEGLVNYNLSLKGMRFGVFFNEEPDIVKISFRSKGDFPANEFAKKYFQGGGHLNAAGGRSFTNLEKTMARFKKCLKEFYATL